MDALSDLQRDQALTDFPQVSIAVLVPCYNEAAAIAQVVADFRAMLPGATVYVYDNNSADDTTILAQKAGAVVRNESQQGKGNVVRRMFSDVEADIYVMVDGDGTYEAAKAPAMIQLLHTGPFDVVNGARVHDNPGAYRPGHVFGNRMLTGAVAWLFAAPGSDMLSGYKALSRRFVKSFPAASRGFEIETELLIYAAELRAPVSEIPTRYSERQLGSMSKLDTLRDGLKITRLIAHLTLKERPLQFFGAIAFAMILLSVLMGTPVVLEYFETGLVPRLPTAVLAVGLMVVGILSFFVGLILDAIAVSARSAKRLAYLAARGR